MRYPPLHLAVNKPKMKPYAYPRWNSSRWGSAHPFRSLLCMGPEPAICWMRVVASLSSEEVEEEDESIKIALLANQCGNRVC